MSDPSQPPPVEGMIEPGPKKRGCFFWGCLTVLVLLAALIGVVWYALSTIIRQYTSDRPAPVPTYEAAPGELEAVRANLRAFEKAADAGQPARLELTADDLNAMIQETKFIRESGAKAFVQIEGDRLLLEASIPLDRFPLPGLRGRYFNGTIELEPALVNGRLEISAVKATVNGHEVPPEYLRGFRHMVIDAHGDDQFSKFLRKARSVEVRDGKLVLEQ